MQPLEHEDGDTSTALSTISSAATLVGPGAVEVFVHKILDDDSLSRLLPQLVKRYHTKQMCIHVVERLLKRYSKDLTLVGSGIQASKTRERRLALAAARFVRRSRFEIAMQICYRYQRFIKGLRHNGVRDQTNAMVSDEEDDEDDDELKDENLMFETIEEVLFDQHAILSLRANIKLSNSLQDVTDGNIFYRLSISAKVSIENAVSSLLEPPIPSKQTRLRFTCRCGHRLYDDFENSQTFALNDFKNLLDSYFGEDVTLEPGDLEPSPTSANSGRDRALGGLMHPWKFVFNRRKQDRRLPWTRQNAGNTELQSCSGGARPYRQANHCIVLLCLPFMRWAKKLHQIDTCHVPSDQAFFLSLRQQYSLVRRSRPWYSFAKPRRVNSLEFVKFVMYRNDLVDIHDSPSVPDREGVMNYTYDPQPAELNPPIGPNLLMHLFQNPTHADVEPIMYKKIPKKYGDRLQACQVKGSVVGWGMHFVEGVDWLALSFYGCLGFLLALVFAVAWSIARDDIQSGFAMGSFMVAFVIFCLGIAQTEVQLGI